MTIAVYVSTRHRIIVCAAGLSDAVVSHVKTYSTK